MERRPGAGPSTGAGTRERSVSMNAPPARTVCSTDLHGMTAHLSAIEATNELHGPPATNVSDRVGGMRARVIPPAR